MIFLNKNKSIYQYTMLLNVANKEVQYLLIYCISTNDYSLSVFLLLCVRVHACVCVWMSCLIARSLHQLEVCFCNLLIYTETFEIESDLLPIHDKLLFSSSCILIYRLKKSRDIFSSLRPIKLTNQLLRHMWRKCGTCINILVLG